MRIAELGRHQSAAFNVDFNAVQCAGEIVQRLVGGIQTLQPPRMVPVVEAFRAEQQMKAPQGMNQASRPRIRSWRASHGRCAGKWPRSVPGLLLGVRVRLSVVTLLLHRHDGPKYQGFPHLLPSPVLNRSLYSIDRLNRHLCLAYPKGKEREGRVPLPIKQARCLPPLSGI